MGYAKPVDVPLLFKLWADNSIRRAEIAQRLGLSHAGLARAVATYGLPPRERQRPSPKEVNPTPEEIAERARECRERHYAMRRAEPPEDTFSKVSKWRRGICQPR